MGSDKGLSFVRLQSFVWTKLTFCHFDILKLELTQQIFFQENLFKNVVLKMALFYGFPGDHQPDATLL